MRVLLLHPEDDFHGSWTNQSWDLVIDLGRAPRSYYDERSSALKCPVSSIFDLAFDVDVEDLKVWRPLLRPGAGFVVDRFGIDWWDVISILLQSELQDVRLALRWAEKLGGCRVLAASRYSPSAEAIAIQLGTPLQLLHRGLRKRIVQGVSRRRAALANLSLEQLLQVAYDKYDPHYAWRRKLAGASPRRNSSASESPSQSRILLPTAYSNVTKTVLSYARLLPSQDFLLVIARESASVSPVPANVRTERLAKFSPEKWDRDELQELEASWKRMENELQRHPGFNSPVAMEIVKKGRRWLRWGMVIRDSWLRVFESYAVTACLCGDDSNPYTRIPLLLAEQHNVPAIACHHGALDCRMAFKGLRFSSYLAKGEMERDYLERVGGVESKRIRIGAATSQERNDAPLWSADAPWITWFVEPYETDLWRAETIYREVLPRLCSVARAAGKVVVLKLHPFESLRDRERLVKRSLSVDDRELVTVTDAPLSRQILQRTWCAVTVESTVAFECAAAGIPAFLCGWLRHAYTGYSAQYVRFGVGRLMESPDELLRIPAMIMMMSAAPPAPDAARGLTRPFSPETLSEVFRNPVEPHSASNM
jgi:hypothetical protein